MSKPTATTLAAVAGPAPFLNVTAISPRHDLICLDCHLVVRYFENASLDQCHGTEVILSQNASATCMFCSLVQYCINKSIGSITSQSSNICGVFNGQELHLYVGEARLNYSIIRCDQENSLSTKNALHLSQNFDPTELREWLSVCDQRPCVLWDENLDLRAHLPKDFRLIDVKQRCIVQPTKLERYCVLSYVWGSAGQFLLKESNFEQLTTSNGIDTITNLPQTILDAIELCVKVGCPYLWVDSLCIIQDSPSDKHSQIRAMDAIYSQSYLGIFAAAGDGANAGLSPFGRHGRQPAIESLLVNVKPSLRLAATLSPQIAAEGIARSTWASRAWTLQEQLLSRRVLFFTGAYAFFRCKDTLQCEHLGLGLRNHYSAFRIWDLPLVPFYRREPDDGRYFSSTFRKVIGAYLRRRLSYPEDFLNAITGVLVRLERDQGGFHWGLPSWPFPVALQWAPEWPGWCTRREGFPSWSWTGWYHEPPNLETRASEQFHDIYEGSDGMGDNFSAVTCWRVGEKGGVELIAEPEVDQLMSASKSHRTECFREFKRSLDVPYSLLQNWIPATGIPHSHYRFIRASCATLYVDPLGNGHYAIRPGSGERQIGAVELRPLWRKDEPEFLQFLAITIGVLPSQENRPSSEENEIGVRVLLIKPRLDIMGHGLPVYERIQFSHTRIRLKDWMACKPKSRLIALV